MTDDQTAQRIAETVAGVDTSARDDAAAIAAGVRNGARGGAGHISREQRTTSHDTTEPAPEAAAGEDAPTATEPGTGDEEQQQRAATIAKAAGVDDVADLLSGDEEQMRQQAARLARYAQQRQPVTREDLNTRPRADLRPSSAPAPATDPAEIARAARQG